MSGNEHPPVQLNAASAAEIKSARSEIVKRYRREHEDEDRQEDQDAAESQREEEEQMRRRWEAEGQDRVREKRDREDRYASEEIFRLVTGVLAEEESGGVDLALRTGGVAAQKDGTTEPAPIGRHPVLPPGRGGAQQAAQLTGEKSDCLSRDGEVRSEVGAGIQTAQLASTTHPGPESEARQYRRQVPESIKKISAAGRDEGKLRSEDDAQRGKDREMAGFESPPHQDSSQSTPSPDSRLPNKAGSGGDRKYTDASKAPREHAPTFKKVSSVAYLSRYLEKKPTAKFNILKETIPGLDTRARTDSESLKTPSSKPSSPSAAPRNRTSIAGPSDTASASAVRKHDRPASSEREKRSKKAKAGETNFGDEDEDEDDEGHPREFSFMEAPKSTGPQRMARRDADEEKARREKVAWLESVATGSSGRPAKRL